MKRKLRTSIYICVALLFSSLLIMSLCGCSFHKELSMYSVDPAEVRGIDAPVASEQDFKDAAAAYGEIHDMTETLGYTSYAVSGEDIDLIYLLLEDETAAKQMALGDRGLDGITLDVICSGTNFDYYEEISDGSTQNIYGLFLRVDNMLILATGDISDRDSVRAKAVDFFNQLGYTEL